MRKTDKPQKVKNERYRRSADSNLQQSKRWSTGCCVCVWYICSTVIFVVRNTLT